MIEIRGKCGTVCNTCSFKDRFGCKGCEAQQGKIFWGECDVYKCAVSKGCQHCGLCAQLPCQQLLDFIENGHNPDRLPNLNRWKNESQ